jgi:hypothetical protein
VNLYMLHCEAMCVSDAGFRWTAFWRSAVLQADDLRLRILQEVQRILTTRQCARALLAVSDYFSRLRALSSYWIARPSTRMNWVSLPSMWLDKRIY